MISLKEMTVFSNVSKMRTAKKCSTPLDDKFSFIKREDGEFET